MRPKHPEVPPSAAVGAQPPAAATSAAPGSLQAPGHEGRPYDIDSRHSLLTILAFRGGALAKAGHNHVIASRDLSGTFYVPQEPMRSTFELRIPVAQLTVDEPELRAVEGPEFPGEVPDSAKEGTRHNMQSEALLDEVRYPDILLASQGLEADTSAPGAAVRAHIQVTVRGQAHTVQLPVTYTLSGGELVASGEFPVKQTELGLTPFSALMGALQVQDEMRVRFRIVARQAETRGVSVPR